MDLCVILLISPQNELLYSHFIKLSSGPFSMNLYRSLQENSTLFRVNKYYLVSPRDYFLSCTSPSSTCEWAEVGQVAPGQRQDGGRMEEGFSLWPVAGDTAWLTHTSGVETQREQEMADGGGCDLKLQGQLDSSLPSQALTPVTHRVQYITHKHTTPGLL